MTPFQQGSDWLADIRMALHSLVVMIGLLDAILFVWGWLWWRDRPEQKYRRLAKRLTAPRMNGLINYQIGDSLRAPRQLSTRGGSSDPSVNCS